MNRFGAVFWLLLVLVAGFATFKAKYAIQDLEDELARVRKQTVAEQQEIRVLTAEWTYLNQPERLAELNKRFLNLVPVATKQLQQRIEDIPLRKPPAAAPVPEDLDQLVAAAVGATSTPSVTEVAATAPALATPVAAGVPASSTPAPPPVTASAPSDTPKPAMVAAATAAPTPAPAKFAAAAAAPAPVATVATEAPPSAAAPVPVAAPPHAATPRLAIVASASAAAMPALPKVAAAAAPASRPVARVQLAKASPASLDALIAKIVEVR